MARFNIPAISVTAVVYIFLIGTTHCKPWMNRGLLVADYDGDGSTDVGNPGATLNIVTVENLNNSDTAVNDGQVLCDRLFIENSGERVACEGDKVLVTWFSNGDDEDKAFIRVEKNADIFS